jgi:hypothetical protein
MTRDVNSSAENRSYDMAKVKSIPTLGVPGLTIGALAFGAEMAAGSMSPLQRLSLGAITVEIMLGMDSVWVLLRRAGNGGLALRTASGSGGMAARVKSKSQAGCVVVVDTPQGQFTIDVTLPANDTPMIRAVTTLKPAADLLVPFLPRDLYPFDEQGDPARTTGTVEAAQRGVNGGVLYFRMEKPAFGNVFYFQNLTALNDYFEATDTKPDGVVGGEWPELGYQPTGAPFGNSPPKNPLPKGKAVVVSDALLQIGEHNACDEQACALEFMNMLAAAYRQIERPVSEFRDWPARSLKTLTDLKRSPKASIEHYGHMYLHPYTASEYPDSMVQISVLAAIAQYAEWRGRPSPLQDALAAGLDKFFDKKLPALRRYLPNVGEDKDKNAVDSWYLYHPLLNLGRMAKGGNAQAREIFVASLPYAVKAARHFDYVWPIQYDVRDFKVITEDRDKAGHGQTDVGGIYAFAMIQAADITGDKSYLDEAARALKKLDGLRFNLIYQANLSAWGAVAAVKLWRETGDSWFFRQAHVFIAGLFHNSEIWESRLKTAKFHKNFLGVTCLHDAPYMAIYECFETLAAFEEYLELAGGDIEPSVQLMIAEYRRYALDRAWFAYPDAQPEDAIAKDDIRNGHIDRNLSFPLEDLYGDGQLSGQVGQEIYGCGAAFFFTALAFHRPRGAPMTLFCDRRLTTIRVEGRSMILHPDTPEGFATGLSLIAKNAALPKTLVVEGGDGKSMPASNRATGRLDYEIAVPGPVTVRW